MFYPAYSPDNVAPLTVISHGSPQQIKHTQGETPPGLGEPLPARLHGYSPAGTARPARSLLTAEPHGLHKSISFQPFWAHSSSFSSKETSISTDLRQQGEGQACAMKLQGRVVSQQSEITDQHFLRDFCSSHIRLSHHADKMFSFFKFQHQGMVLSID